MSRQAWRFLLPGPVLSRTDLPNPADLAAPRLLGCYLLSRIGGTLTGGRIVETEAYLGAHDPASHAAERVGRTSRNAAMFGPAGTAYVYFIYGMHWCCNVVTGDEGDPQAVLIRAIEPVFGVDVMARRRGIARNLTNGPARLCQALGIGGDMNGHPLHREPLLLFATPARPRHEIGVSGRVGVSRAAKWPLRFFISGHPDVSRAKTHVAGHGAQDR